MNPQNKTFWKTEFIPTLLKTLTKIRAKNPTSSALRTLDSTHENLQSRLLYASNNDYAAFEFFIFAFSGLTYAHQIELTGKTDNQWLNGEKEFYQKMGIPNESLTPPVAIRFWSKTFMRMFIKTYKAEEFQRYMPFVRMKIEALHGATDPYFANESVLHAVKTTFDSCVNNEAAASEFFHTHFRTFETQIQLETTGRTYEQWIAYETEVRTLATVIERFKVDHTNQSNRTTSIPTDPDQPAISTAA